MLAKTKVGVVIPVFNRARSVVYALDSVARQTYSASSLVVIDDGSTDNSAAIIRNWIMRQGSIESVVMKTQSNAGVAAARNRGLALLADCTHVAFLDSDDIWPLDFLERAIHRFTAIPEAIAATCDRRSIDPDGTLHVDDLTGLADAPARWMLFNGAGIASCSLFQASAVHRLGGFPSELRSGEDTYLFLRLSRLGPWLHIAGPQVEFNRKRPGELGDATSLSSRYYDNARRWAYIYEDYFTRELPELFHDPYIRLGLARAWYRAGRELINHGYHRDARSCFSRSLTWKPWRLKTWLKVAQTSVAA